MTAMIPHMAKVKAKGCGVLFKQTMISNVARTNSKRLVEQDKIRFRECVFSFKMKSEV